ncbi:scoloptoxin SSD552-like [Haemaphysalis longicornis]
MPPRPLVFSVLFWFSLGVLMIVGDPQCPPTFWGKKTSHVFCDQIPIECFATSNTTTWSDKAAIMETHNRYRAMVAQGHLSDFPPAANMLAMRWDDGLAETAAYLASLCVRADTKTPIEKDPEDLSAPRFEASGHNSYYSFTNETRLPVIWQLVIRDWFEQAIKYSAQKVGAYDAKANCSAFAQVVWARTHAVGCSHTISNHTALTGPRTIVDAYVCLYGPLGALPGDELYKAGPSCSLCPQFTTCNASSGLCELHKDEPGPDKTFSTPPPHRPGAPTLGCQGRRPARILTLLAASVVLLWRRALLE